MMPPKKYWIEASYYITCPLTNKLKLLTLCKECPHCKGLWGSGVSCNKKGEPVEIEENCFYCGKPMHPEDYPDNAKVPLYQGCVSRELDYSLIAHVTCEEEFERDER